MWITIWVAHLLCAVSLLSLWATNDCWKLWNYTENRDEFSDNSEGGWMTAVAGLCARKYGAATATQGPPTFLVRKSMAKLHLRVFWLKYFQSGHLSPHDEINSVRRELSHLNRKFPLCHQSVKRCLTTFWVASGVCAHFYEHQGHYLPVRGSSPARGSPWALLIWHHRVTLTSITWEQPISLLALALPCSHYVSVEKRRTNQTTIDFNQMCSRVPRSNFGKYIDSKICHLTRA